MRLGKKNRIWKSLRDVSKRNMKKKIDRMRILKYIGFCDVSVENFKRNTNEI